MKIIKTEISPKGVCKKLHPGEIIQIGEYAGETLESCVKKYGRKSIFGVLKWYELSDELLSEYHIHKKDSPLQNKGEWQNGKVA